MKNYKIIWEEHHEAVVQAKNKKEVEELWSETDLPNDAVEISMPPEIIELED